MQSFADYVEPIRAAIPTETHRTEFAALATQCEAELSPCGLLENLFASTILMNIWRLRHRPDLTDADRVRFENSIRRNTAELRRFQTDRYLKAELNLDLPGLISAKEVLKLRKQEKSAKLQNEPKPVNIAALELDLEAELDRLQKQQLAEFALRQQNSANLKKQTHLVGRNSPCPCGSGQKHKRCCGVGAPPIYNQAA